MNCSWLKGTFWQYVTIHGLDKYNTMFQNVKIESFNRKKFILKFHNDCHFAG